MKPEMKKLIIANLPYLLFVYLFGKLGQAYRLAEGIDLSQKFLHFADGCAAAFESAAPSFHPIDLLIGVAGAAALRLMVYCKGKNAKKYRKGVEYGSARWGGPKDIAPYIDPNFDNNILLTQTERLTMNNRPKDPKTARNKNVLVIGGSGSGKTRFFVKPNLMQCVSKDYPTSFVITDPKGSLIGEVGQLLIRSGYRVKVLNTINFSKSMKYNPFRYLHSEKDVLKLVNTLICNTRGEGEKSAEDFWVKSERLFYTALIGYIWQEAPEDEMNFSTLLEMLNASEAREDDPESFMVGIEEMTRNLISRYSQISEDAQKLFQTERVVIGKCPRCGEAVYEGKKNYYCGNRACQFVMWKNDRFFEERGKTFTPKIAAALLKDGKAKVKGLSSMKTGKTYDGAVLLADTGGKYVNYRVEKKS